MGRSRRKWTPNTVVVVPTVAVGATYSALRLSADALKATKVLPQPVWSPMSAQRSTSPSWCTGRFELALMALPGSVSRSFFFKKRALRVPFREG